MRDSTPSLERNGPHGASIAGTADALALSEGTVRNYLSVAIQKLDERSQFEATRIAGQKGWI